MTTQRLVTKNLFRPDSFNFRPMKKYLLLFITVLFSFSGYSQTKQEKLPNIIIFLADDLGYGETGAYGQKIIETPNVDKLAKNGMKFTQHYAGAPVCAPSRCVLLTGLNTGHAYIRGNDEWKERGDVWNYLKVIKDPGLEGQRPIPDSIVTIAEILKTAGYKTALIGKWGLGAPHTEGAPTRQGFDYFYGYNCQRQAHNLYPPYLWENDEKDYLDNEVVVPHTKLPKHADPYDEASYAKYTQKEYAPAVMHEKAINFIKENSDKPFLMVYATPLPHVPLQAPKEWVKKYHKKFGDEEPYLGEHGYFPCRYPRATYAAMISFMDYTLGDLVKNLKDLGIYNNTLLIFTSDNGPTYAGGVDYNFFQSSKPFQDGYGRTKGFVYEGGIRVPMIAAWPDKIKKGSESELISVFYDYLPTLCDVSGLKVPVKTDGISFLPELLGEPQKKHNYLYWDFPEYGGQQAVRLGNWKGIRKNINKGNMAIELYNLKNDITESVDVSSQNPEVVFVIRDIMKKEHTTSPIPRFRMKALDGKDEK